ncbi:hypothetical protein FB45DRAFT_944659 [Roridomyces roridus]|uniref:Uncharacterized protein n=1 Tax=Roridomyces roridus TaxID=1738132 RepID=A0AAD7B452_9AGAR|nr:hypothetical protein FB45DRAFT_944659 [Roridomyces roridus]
MSSRQVWRHTTDSSDFDLRDQDDNGTSKYIGAASPVASTYDSIVLPEPASYRVGYRFGHVLEAREQHLTADVNSLQAGRIVQQRSVPFLPEAITIPGPYEENPGGLIMLSLAHRDATFASLGGYVTSTPNFDDPLLPWSSAAPQWSYDEFASEPLEGISLLNTWVQESSGGRHPQGFIAEASMSTSSTNVDNSSVPSLPSLTLAHRTAAPPLDGSTANVASELSRAIFPIDLRRDMDFTCISNLQTFSIPPQTTIHIMPTTRGSSLLEMNTGYSVETAVSIIHQLQVLLRSPLSLETFHTSLTRTAKRAVREYFVARSKRAATVWRGFLKGRNQVDGPLGAVLLRGHTFMWGFQHTHGQWVIHVEMPPTWNEL